MNDFGTRLLRIVWIKMRQLYIILLVASIFSFLSTPSYSAMIRIEVSVVENTAIIVGFLDVSENESVSGVQIELSILPSGWSVIEAIPGEVLIAGGKELLVSGVGNTVRILVVGFNNQRIPMGGLFSLALRFYENGVPNDFEVDTRNVVFSSPSAEPVEGSAVVLKEEKDSEVGSKDDGHESGSHLNQEAPSTGKENDGSLTVDSDIGFVRNKTIGIDEEMNGSSNESRRSEVATDKRGMSKFREGMSDYAGNFMGYYDDGSKPVVSNKKKMADTLNSRVGTNLSSQKEAFSRSGMGFVTGEYAPGEMADWGVKNTQSSAHSR
ncbi:MAG: hypothetical protein N3G21_08675, partial [Candidatus Hydrogenedentes bacterium]|nr:hypothetical protein [Candidatus Hydrogenedentota bacterium]